MKHRFLWLILALMGSLLICAPCHAGFYRYNIDELARKAKVRIKEIDNKLKEEEIAKDVNRILADLTSLYEKAEALFAERRYEEAVTVYRKIDRMGRNSVILQTLKKAGE